MPELLREEFTLRETKVKIISDSQQGITAAKEKIFSERKALEAYTKIHPEFLSSLKPLKLKKGAPKIAKEMASAALLAGVGPMAAVAGAIAEHACKAMVEAGAKTALVENGGDCFAVANQPITVGLFAGNNLLKDRLAFRLEKGTRISFCSSSGTMGHSFSLGKCDLATVFAKKGAVADAFATALANRIKGEEDIAKALRWLKKSKKVAGAIAVKAGKIGFCGKIPRLVKNADTALSAKITSF
ncbi:MAG: UPF0280 family protein [Candidatus Diapherotrites archaeon]